MKVQHFHLSECFNKLSFLWVASVLLVVLFSLPGCTVRQLEMPETANNKVKYKRLTVHGSRPPWTDTGFSVQTGDEVLLFAAGKVTTWPKSGHTRNRPPEQVMFLKIGKNQYRKAFDGDDAASFISHATGKLKLAVRDWPLEKGYNPAIHRDWYRDNTGSFIVDVYVIPKDTDIDSVALLEQILVNNPEDALVAEKYHLFQGGRLLSAAKAGVARMSLEEARDVAVSMHQIPLAPPPRRVDDVFAKLDDNGKTDPLETDPTRGHLDWVTTPPGYAAMPELREGLTSRQTHKLSRLEMRKGNYKTALELAQAAIAKTIDQADRIDIVFYAHIAEIYLNMGDFVNTRTHLNKARNIHNRLPRGWKVNQPQLQAAILRTEAKLMEAQGNLAAANQARSISLNVWVKDRDRYHRQAIAARIGVALNLKAQGRTVEAEMEARQAFQEAFGQYGSSNYLTALTVYALGEIVLAQGRPADALKLARATVAIMNKIASEEKRDMLIRSRLFAGSVFNAQNSFQRAMRQYEFAMVMAKPHPYFFKKYILRDAGIVVALIEAGRKTEALDLIAASISIYDQVGVRNHYETAEMVALRGMALALANEKKRAFEDFRNSIPTLLASGSRQSDDYCKKQRLNIIVEAYLDLLSAIRNQGLEQDFGIDAVRESFEIAAAISDSSVQFALNESAVRAAATSDPELSELVRREQDTNKQIVALQSTLATALAAPADQQDAAAIQTLRNSILDLNRARETLVDTITKDFPRYSEYTNAQPVSLVALQQHLRKDEALITIWTARKRTYVWAIPHQGETQFAAVSIGSAEMNRRVANLRLALEPQLVTFGDIPDFDLARAYELYQKLLLPVQKGWQTARELLVTVKGPLGGLPLAVLPRAPVKLSADNGILFNRYRSVPWLIRDYAITRLPSVSSLAMLRTLSKGDPGRRSFLGFGDPLFNMTRWAAKDSQQTIPAPVHRSGRLSIRGIRLTDSGNLDNKKILSTQLSQLVRLPDTADEIRDIGNILAADPELDIYLGPRATEHQVKSMPLANRKVIAFATHALVPGDLDGLNQPALALCTSPAADDYEDGLLTMGEILMLNMNADWVILSACNTGAADGAGAEAVSGLGRAFFYAGTKALLVSMWPVETTSARLLTTGLFEHQKKDTALSRSGALRKSMLRLIDEKALHDDATGQIIARYAHPLFWAPFVVIGDNGN